MLIFIINVNMSLFFIYVHIHIKIKFDSLTSVSRVLQSGHVSLQHPASPRAPGALGSQEAAGEF